MKIGDARVSKQDGSQPLDLQLDATRVEGETSGAKKRPRMGSVLSFSKPLLLEKLRTRTVHTCLLYTSDAADE